MSGQQGFATTDHLPPINGPTFSKEDVDDLGLELCLRIWKRLQDDSPSVSLGDYRASLRTRRWFEFWRGGSE